MFVANNLHEFLGYKDFQCISVIASFNSSGQIKPIYVQMNGESYKIHSCHYNHPLPNISEFNCQIIDHDCLKPLKLVYYHAESVWAIKV